MKLELFRGLPDAPQIVELGPGTGVNFRYFPQNSRWSGVEPNRHLHPALHKAAATAGFVSHQVLELDAERLPFRDSSVEAIVATLVLCSVGNPATVLAEVLRVLRPAGRFYFVEHVGAPLHTPRRRGQDCLQPFWSWIADGCHPNRDTLPLIRQAGFVRVEAREFSAPLGLFSPHVAGWAEKQGG